MLTQAEQSKCDARSNVLDLDRVSNLHYVGNYVRELPVTMARMMENAFDWEHLPHVHSSSFASIELVSLGSWGWRAKVGLPETSGGGHQLLDLLVDAESNYWATTVISGPGEGTEIHTQATKRSENKIEVDVRFYVPEKLDDSVSNKVLAYLKDQYELLYDEDLGLMSGRQSALEAELKLRSSPASRTVVKVGLVADLDQSQVYTVQTPSGRFCVRQWNDEWIVHSAICPHMLGPLAESQIKDDGHITCPWHGYRFDIRTGANLDKKCSALTKPPQLIERDGMLFIGAED